MPKMRKRMTKEGHLIEEVFKNPCHIPRKLEPLEQRSKDSRQASLVKEYLQDTLMLATLNSLQIMEIMDQKIIPSYLNIPDGEVKDTPTMAIQIEKEMMIPRG